jgi:hypothetical protein
MVVEALAAAAWHLSKPEESEILFSFFVRLIQEVDDRPAAVG